MPTVKPTKSVIDAFSGAAKMSLIEVAVVLGSRSRCLRKAAGVFIVFNRLAGNPPSDASSPCCTKGQYRSADAGL
jgi:hypothetical protein